MELCNHYSTRVEKIPFTPEQKQEHIHRTGYIPTWNEVFVVVCECTATGAKKKCRCLGCKAICDFKE